MVSLGFDGISRPLTCPARATSAFCSDLVMRRIYFGTRFIDRIGRSGKGGRRDMATK